jgi:SulP family sulfate permease
MTTLNHLAPFLEDLRIFTWLRLRRDVVAGLTVAVFAVPQAMAYAMLAGAPPVYGLYAAMVMSIVAALWGSSPFINTGPTNSAALLAGAALLPWADRPDVLGLLFGLTFLVGVGRLLLGLCRAGRLFHFVPECGLLGFAAGAGVLIVGGQLHHLLGIAAGKSSWFVLRMSELVPNAVHTHGPTLAMGVGCLLALLLLERTRLKTVAPLLALGGAACLAHFVLPPGVGVRTVGDISPIPCGLPRLTLPNFDPTVMASLIPSALAIAVIGLIEAASIGQTLALRHHRAEDFNQEFIGQGLSHLVASFFQAMPGSGSFTRSLLIEQAGGVSRFANVFFGLWTAAAVLSLPPALEAIPVSALAGLLLFIGWKLVDVRRIRRVLATSRTDALVMGATFLVTVFYRIEAGVFVGTVMAALVFLGRAGRVQLNELIPAGPGRYEEIPYDGVTLHAASDLVALSVSGDLFYGMSHALRQQLAEVKSRQAPRVLLLRLRRASSIDSACWGVLADLAEQLYRAGGSLYLSGVGPEVQPILVRSGLQRWIPDHQVFLRNDRPFAAFDQCVQAARAALPADAHLSAPWRTDVGEMDGSGV